MRTNGCSRYTNSNPNLLTTMLTIVIMLVLSRKIYPTSSNFEGFQAKHHYMWNTSPPTPTPTPQKKNPNKLIYKRINSIQKTKRLVDEDAKFDSPSPLPQLIFVDCVEDWTLITFFIYTSLEYNFVTMKDR